MHRRNGPSRRPGLTLAALALAFAFVALGPARGSAADAAPSQGTITKLEVEGAEFISKDAFLALTDLEVGDRFDKQALQAEFWKVWNTGLFEDLRIEEAPAPGGGHVVIFIVREKPRIDSVTMESVKAVGQSRIDEVLKQNDALVTANSTLDQERIGKAKKIMEELLASEGFPDARVTVLQRRVARSRVALEFKIDPGPKIKIDEITFTGNTVFSNNELKKRLKNSAERSFLKAFSSKSVFYRPRFEEDLQGVRDAYRSKGYIDVEIGEPVMRDARPGKSGKEERRYVKLEVPVKEGKQYRLSALTISGNSVFATDDLRPLIPLAPGEVLNDGLLRLGLTRIDNRYGDEGYLYAASAPRYDKDPASATASVDVQVTEGASYTVRRIEFDGNAKTRDEVLRREMRLQEGDKFSRTDFLVSTRKLAQLGFWELDGEPTITPSPTGKDEVDITVRGKEVGRNEIQFGGGYSGVDGFFGTFSFASRNFIGRGSQLSLSGQIGGATTRYSLAYVEPYFMRTRSTLGGSLFSRDEDFDGFDRRGKGATAFWSYPTSTFSYFRTTASWEDSKIVGSRSGSVSNDQFTTYSVTPALTFDDRDNPFRPTRGRRMSVDLELGASQDHSPNQPPGFEVGTVNFTKPEFGFTEYWRTFKRQYVGIHVEGGLLTALSGGGKDPHPVTGIDPPFLPVFERYFLGGERSIRGVTTRSVGPRLKHFPHHDTALDCNGDGDVEDAGEAAGSICPDAAPLNDLAIGGDAYWLANFEYSFPFSNIFEATAFMDVGNSFGVNHLDLLRLVNADDSDRLSVVDSDPFEAKATAGIEFRFHTPVLQQPLRLIYGCKVYGDFLDDQGTCDFQFSIGRTFQ